LRYCCDGKRKRGKEEAIVCDQVEGLENEEKIKLSSCSDSGTTGDKKKCENMFDDNTDQNTANGGCYVSQGNWKVFVEATFNKPSTVTAVSILGKGNGSKLKGTVISVCDNGKCTQCTTVENAWADSCNTLKCESHLEGTSIKLENKNDGIVICDLAVFGKSEDEESETPICVVEEGAENGGEATEPPAEPEKTALEIDSCKDSGTKNADMNCNNMFDGDESRKQKACFVSTYTKEVFAELWLAKKQSVSSVHLLSKDNGADLQGVKIEVCKPNGKTCNLCGKVGEVSLDDYTKVDCESTLEGKMVKVTNKSKRIIICEAKIFS